MNSYEEKSDHSPIQNLFIPYYKSFIEKEDARMILWILKEEHQSLLQEFIQSENNGSGVFDDRFILLKSPFITQSDYTQELLKELTSIAANNRQNEIHSNYIENNALVNLFKDLANIQTKSLKPSQNLVLWLKPSSISGMSEFEQWLGELLDTPFPNNIKVAFDKESDGNYFENLLIKHGVKIFLSSPDDNNAYSELVENQEDPSVQFRLHFMKFGEAISSGEQDRALNHGELALNIARQQENWEQLEVGILIAMAEVLIEDESQQEKALKYLDQAESSAKKACEKENPAGQVLLVQTLNAIGSAYIYLGDFNLAIKQFEAAIAKAEKDDYCLYYLMEAQRLIALCFEHNGEYLKAWDFNDAALKTAENLEPQIRSYTTLPNIGEALIRLSSTLNRNQEINRINEKMVEFVGEHWEEML